MKGEEMLNNLKVSSAVKHLQEVMKQERIDPRKGLPEDLFLFATSLIPIANVDLFIHRDAKVLLSWRDDEFHGKGWHIPGGCIRIKETCENRIQQTALNEIGCRVSFNPTPIMVKEDMTDKSRPWLDNELMRSHNISILYDCELPEKFEIGNSEEREHVPGCLKWFSDVPNDLLECHKRLYGDFLKEWFERVERV